MLMKQYALNFSVWDWVYIALISRIKTEQAWTDFIFFRK